MSVYFIQIRRLALFLWTRFLIASWLCLITCRVASAETGVLVVHVQDVERRPVSGLQIGVEGDGGSAITGDDGKARIPLAKQTHEKSWVSLQIVRSPPGRDFVLISPWDYKTLIPPFENDSENFVDVVVVQRGDRAMLENRTLLTAAVAKIARANALRIGKQAQADPQTNLTLVAEQYGLTPEDLDRAIRAWGASTTDPYEAGLVALYERNYSVASVHLSESLRQREEKLAVDQNAIVDASFFLGKSLYEEGKYRESATAYQRCFQICPNDSAILNNLALSLNYAGDYASAEQLCRRALVIEGKKAEPDRRMIATGLNNLAEILRAEGDYEGAELLYRRALAMNEKDLGPDNIEGAHNLLNLAELQWIRGNYVTAEKLCRRALAIEETKLGSDHPEVAVALNGLALVAEAKGDYAKAETLCRRALAIGEKWLGSNHPDVGNNLGNLARLLYLKGDYANAEPLYRRALVIHENRLGPNHRDVAVDLNDLGLLLQAKGDYRGAELLFRRALAIDEKTLGPNHPEFRQIHENLEFLNSVASTGKPNK